MQEKLEKLIIYCEHAYGKYFYYEDLWKLVCFCLAKTQFIVRYLPFDRAHENCMSVFFWVNQIIMLPHCQTIIKVDSIIKLQAFNQNTFHLHLKSNGGNLQSNTSAQGGGRHRRSLGSKILRRKKVKGKKNKFKESHKPTSNKPWWGAHFLTTAHVS